MILFAAPAAYLLGWLRLEGIKADQDVTIPRLLLGLFLLAFSLSLWPGMSGASLGDLDAYVPLATKSAGGATGGYAALPWKKNDLAGALAQAKGFTRDGALTPTTKAAAVIAWLKADYDLGHGHSMAVFALLKGRKKEGDM